MKTTVIPDKRLIDSFYTIDSSLGPSQQARFIQNIIIMSGVLKSVLIDVECNCNDVWHDGDVPVKTMSYALLFIVFLCDTVRYRHTFTYHSWKPASLSLKSSYFIIISIIIETLHEVNVMFSFAAMNRLDFQLWWLQPFFVYS